MGATSIANLNKPINDRMDAMALALVRQVERKKKARVVHMVTEFLVDSERCVAMHFCSLFFVIPRALHGRLVHVFFFSPFFLFFRYDCH